MHYNKKDESHEESVSEASDTAGHLISCVEVSPIYCEEYSWALQYLPAVAIQGSAWNNGAIEKGDSAAIQGVRNILLGVGGNHTL